MTDDRIYAYSIGDNLRDPGREFDALKAANNRRRQGNLVRRQDDHVGGGSRIMNWIYAYNMPEPSFVHIRRRPFWAIRRSWSWAPPACTASSH